MEEIETIEEKPEPEPKVIGLTGGIGSGKTTVAEMLQNKGFQIYLSDLRAKNLVNENTALKQQIKDLLGVDAYDKNELYDRKFVAAKVFEENDLLEKLNNIIHPAVKDDFRIWLYEMNDSKIVIKETALLFELQLDKFCFKNVLVTAEDNTRIKRVMDRDGKTYREVESIMNKQMLEKDKIKKADYVIHNNGTLEELEAEVDSLIKQIKNEIENN